MKKQNGFTLVEIAIVLVIIGLLLGGALKGQELIENAKYNRVKSDYDQISAAVYSYQDRYQALPGDDPNAEANVDAPTGQAGNGNGLINGAWNNINNPNLESRFIWQHLRLAGFITGTGLAQPRHAFGGMIGIENDRFNIQGMVMCFDNFDGEKARIIDLKFDDGAPGTGSVQAGGNNGNAAANYNDATANLDICFEM